MQSIRPPVWVLALLLAGVTPLQGATAQSQDNIPHSDRLWLTTGLGFGRTGGSHTPLMGGLAAGAGLTYQPGVILFTLRAGGIWNPFRADILGDAAFLVGAGTRGLRSHASIAVGPGLAGGDLRAFEASHTRFSSQLGLGIQAQVLALPLSSVGAGLVGFANLNRRQSFGGVMLALGFGQLR